jgi:hypothetical protein
MLAHSCPGCGKIVRLKHDTVPPPALISELLDLILEARH